ncbi:MAG: NADH-quinone oxidoreductase subunit J [Deltaproteobacteria bacterium]|nr:NADH-quinone oxidoreductase subunit J [Deltaproteobacteria bacterium]
MDIAQLGFVLLSAVTIAGALGATTINDLPRALLSLVLFFFGVAALFFMLHAEFIGVVQVLVYVGAVAVLFVFAIVLTRARLQATEIGRLVPSRVLGILGAAVVGAGLVGVVVRTTDVPLPAVAPLGTTAPIGEALMTRYLLPFEIASVLLTAALIGAVVIALEDGEQRRSA